MEHQSKLIKVLKNQIFIIGCKHIICLSASGPVQTRGQGNNGGGASGWVEETYLLLKQLNICAQRTSLRAASFGNSLN